MTKLDQVSSTAQVERVVYFDYLRIIATFAVIVIHLCSQKWYHTDVNGIKWQILNVYMSTVRWAVPVFAMLSGALFLDRNVPLKTVFSKYILRLAAAYLFWSTLYAFLSDNRSSELFYNVVIGKFHLWFIPMIIGQYICLPIYKQVADSKEVTRYFLIVSFAATFLLPQIIQLLQDFGSDAFVRLGDCFRYLQANMNLNLVFGCSFYFIGGFYLRKTDLTPKIRALIYLGGILGVFATILLDAGLSIKLQMPVDNYYGYLTVNVLLESLAVFVWLKYHCPQIQWLNALAGKLSKYSFGAYLVHVLVIEQLDLLLGIDTFSCFPGVSVPVLAVVVFVLSFAISWGLHQIPRLKKYIV